MATASAAPVVPAILPSKSTKVSSMPHFSAERIPVALFEESTGMAFIINPTICINKLGYQSVLDYDRQNLENPTISLLGTIVKSGIPVLVYSGDQDSVIPLTGSRTLVNRLAASLGLNTTVPYRVWFEGKQVGGWTQVYDDILPFATIRGASREALFSQPEKSLVLFKSFLQGRPLPETFS